MSTKGSWIVLNNINSVFKMKSFQLGTSFTLPPSLCIREVSPVACSVYDSEFESCRVSQCTNRVRGVDGFGDSKE